MKISNFTLLKCTELRDRMHWPSKTLKPLTNSDTGVDVPGPPGETGQGYLSPNCEEVDSLQGFTEGFHFR